MAASDSSDSGRGHSFAAVYGKLREAILTGEIEPGAITTQMALAEQFDVGRTPLREALRVLQNEGLVVNEPNRRVQITPLTVADAEELYIARVSLESTAVRQTIPTFTSRDDAELIGYLAQMDHYGQGRDWAGLRNPHRAFHARLYREGGARIVALVTELSDHAERYRLVDSPSREHWMRRQDEHRAIAAATGDRDADRAAQLLIEHYARTAAIVCADLEPDADLGRLRALLRRVAPSAEKALDEATRAWLKGRPRERRSRPVGSARGRKAAVG